MHSKFVEISSELVQISSDLVEISSELVQISSEPVLRISELLKTSTFKKSPIVVSRTTPQKAGKQTQNDAWPENGHRDILKTWTACHILTLKAGN